MRDPLLALGCRDPVEAVARAKAEDLDRRAVAAAFDAWRAAHGERPVKLHALAESVRVILDPQGRGRQHLESRLRSLSGTRLAGWVLTRQAGVGRWGTATYALRPAAATENSERAGHESGVAERDLTHPVEAGADASPFGGGRGSQPVSPRAAGRKGERRDHAEGRRG